MTESATDRLVQDQIAYYRARACEYDEWFMRRGRYDHGPDANRQWFAEVEEVARALAAFHPAGRVLDLACGTGWWTEQLVRTAGAITAVDASPEVLDLNQSRVNDPKVRYVQADLFAWQPDEQYDLVLFSFWLSHVPPERFEVFWTVVRDCLAPDGRVFFIDSRYNPTSTARDQVFEGTDAVTMTRRLNDGRAFRIVKIYYRPDELATRLADLSWRVTVRTTANHFLYGSGTPVEGAR